MKNIITIKTILVSLILCLLLAGCSDLNGGSKTCTVTGAISMSDVDNSRSAASSFTDWDSVSLYAEQGSNKIAGSVTNGSYSVVLNSSGQWTITAYAESSSTKILQGSVTVTIPDPVESVTNAHIVLLPCFNSEVTGNISLKLKDETTGSKLSKVTFKGTGLSAGTATFTNGLATVSIPSCQPKSYDVAFSFEDSIGNTLYKCRETITVFSGLTTGTWSGDGTHLRKTAQGTTEFVITDELVEGYGTELVPNTQMVLYNYDYYATNNYDFFIVDDVNASLGATSDCTAELQNSFPYFFFDASSKMYVFNKGSYSMVNIADSASYDISSFVKESFSSMAFDRQSGTFYVSSTTYTNGDNNCYLSACEKSKLSSASTEKKQIVLTPNFTTYSEMNDQLKYYRFAVNNGVLYFSYRKLPESGDNDQNFYLRIVTADLSSAEYNATDNQYELSLTDSLVTSYPLFSNLTKYPVISDMLYQDGCLYLLLNDGYIDSSWSSSTVFRSRGALARINLFNNTVSTLGWTDNAIDTSSAGAYIKRYSDGNNYFYSDAEKTSLFVVDGTKKYTDPDVKINTLYPTIYAPDGGKNLSASAFYGPQKFIAIKPKKLVIADDGIAYYTNDDGALAYRNVNRVVVVDLETFAMESWDETSVTFAGDASSSFNGDYSQVVRGDTDITNGANFYYATSFAGSIYDSNGARVDNVMNEDMYLAIKCEDND